VARMVRTPGSLSIDIFDRRIGKRVHYPPILGRLTGIGGDGDAPIITRDAARQIIDSDPDAMNEGKEVPSG
jgi:hypothetical protein